MPARLLGLVGRAKTSSPPCASATKLPLVNAVSYIPSSESLLHDSEKRDVLHTMDHFKRHSYSASHDKRSRDRKSPDRRESPKLEPAKPAKMDMIIESPPILFMGKPDQSSGALFSGMLQIDVIEPTIVLESFEMRLLCSTTTKKPVAPNCPDCMTKTTDLFKWTFVKEPKKLKRGQHGFPFSYLFPGHLPATVYGSLAILDYHLSAEAKTSTGESISYGRPIVVARAIQSGNDKHSIRVFPPTNMTASVTVPSVVYPIGDFNVDFRLNGISSPPKNNARTHWRLRKLTWRIEEHQKIVSPACSKHADKVGGEGKGMEHDVMRIIGEDDLKQGWKTDFKDGQIEMEIKCAINTSLKPLCDVEAPNGLKVTHFLSIECVVAEEWGPLDRPKQLTATGAARILRTQFNLVVTERQGMGISWDEEQPPVYEDVPGSPPTYTQMQDFDLAELDGDVDRMHLS